MYHSVLNVPRDATLKEIKKAYKTLALKNHPDKGGNKEYFQSIIDAYEKIVKQVVPTNEKFECVKDCWCCDRNEIE